MYLIKGTQIGGSICQWREACQARARARFDYCRSNAVYVSAEIIGPEGQFIARWERERNLD